MFAFDRLTFNRESARSRDEDGRLHVSKTNISKATVNPYYGREIPGYEELGLEADKIYRLLRDPKELEKGAATFNNLPILSRHEPHTTDNHAPELVIGSIGSDVAYEEPYLTASVCFYDPDAINLVDSGAMRDLSAAYRYDPVMTPGEYNGQEYDGIMTNIRGNHLALVEVGRAGRDVVVADSSPFKGDGMARKLGDKIKAALAQDVSPAALGKIIELVEGEGMENEDYSESGSGENEQAPEIGNDNDDAAKQAALKMLADAGLSEEQISAIVSAFAPAPAVDEIPEKEKVGFAPAMDADSIRKLVTQQLLQREEAQRAVMPIVGNVYGLDSAEAILDYALKQKGIKSDGVNYAGKLQMVGLLADKAAIKPKIAQDSSPYKFPASRYSTLY